MAFNDDDPSLLWDRASALLRATSEAIAFSEAYEIDLRPEDGAAARDRLCQALAAASDERIWAQLDQIAADTEANEVAEGLAAVNLDAFHQAEMQIYLEAGVNPRLAEQWTLSTTSLLYTLASAGDPEEVRRLWTEVPQARAHVLVARERICSEPVPDIVPAEGHGNALDLARRKRFRTRLLGAAKVGFGAGTALANGAAALGTLPVVGFAVPVAFFAKSSIVTGIGTVLNGLSDLNQTM